MKPYYSSPDGAIVVYHARFEDVLAAGLVPVESVALVHADPPYGVSERTDRGTVGRNGALSKISAAVRHGAKVVREVGKAQDWEAIEGDDRPFDPAPLLALQRPLVTWGANHYSPRVPESPSWILWDKREWQGSDDNADGELAWSNLGGPLRIFRHWWRGALRKTEKENRHLGPTQKPIALSTWIFNKAKLKRGDLVLVPYLGSGPDLPAARAMGLRVIACDVSEEACRIACSARLGVVVKPEPVEKLGPLFSQRSSG